MKDCPKCGGSGRIEDDAKVGANMRKQRESADLSLRYVADKMGISPAYLCDLEHGRRIWSAELRSRYEGALTGIRVNPKRENAA